ncbi:hypothetical protein FRC01_011604, partial [Tulasnella sp. 417]
MVQILGEALLVLTGPECKELVGCDDVLRTMLHGIVQMIVGQVHSSITLQHKFALLEICEPILHSPRLTEPSRQMIRKARLDLAQAWQGELVFKASRNSIPVWLVEMPERYITALRKIYSGESGYKEYLEILKAFGPTLRELFSYRPKAWATTSGFRTRFAFRDTFETFLLDIDYIPHQAQLQ